jgi:HK97 family phage major capsid protein
MTAKTPAQILDQQVRDDLARYGSVEAIIEARDAGDAGWRRGAEGAETAAWEARVNAADRRTFSESSTVQDTYGALNNRVRAAHALAHATPASSYRAKMANIPEYRMAFEALIRGPINEDQRMVLSAGRFDAGGPESRDQTTGTGSSGGYTIPQAFRTFLQTSLLDGAPILGLATTVETAGGATMKYPVIDDTAQLATILVENNPVNTTTDPSLTQISLGAFSVVAPAVLVPWSLNEDAAGLDILKVVADIAGDRVGRGVDRYLAVGTGSGQPLGISAATVGATTAANTGVTYAEWEAAYFSLRAAYRGPAARWVMHSETYEAALALTDTSGRAVFDREHQTMFSVPVVCDDSMAQIGSAAVVAVVGRFDKGYVVRQVVPTLAMILHERYADVLASAVIVATRIDATLSDAAALRSLVCHV